MTAITTVLLQAYRANYEALLAELGVCVAADTGRRRHAPSGSGTRPRQEPSGMRHAPLDTHKRRR